MKLHSRARGGRSLRQRGAVLVRALLLAGPIALASAMLPAAASAAFTWSGTWSSNWGTMELTGSDASMSGTYTHDDGHIQLTLSDAVNRVYVGTWDEAPTRTQPNDGGAAEFTVSADGKSFTGSWRYGTGDGWSGGWTGTCISGACLSNGGTTSDAEPPDWPLRSALVSLASVSNGCGGGTASTDPQFADTSTYLNSNNPFGTRYPVNFRLACQVHDAAYSGAKVKDPFHRNKLVDFFDWEQPRIDRRFLDDMRTICVRSIPASAPGARADCRSTGGKTSFGAQSRYNVVYKWGHKWYIKRPALTGSWRIPGTGGPVWTISQSGRLVTANWSSGPTRSGFAKGIIVSRDQDSLISGFEKVKENDKWSIGKLTMTYNPKLRNSLIISSVSGSGTMRRGSLPAK